MGRVWTICCGALAAISITLVSGANAAHPGRNGLIAFVDGDSVYSMHPDGTHRRKLTVPEQQTFRLSSPKYPSWSPDGKKIAFVALREPFSGEPETDVFVMNADGSNLHMVAESARGAVSWSPDGSELAYTDHFFASGVEHRYVAVVSADGRRGRTIAGASFDPAWSPDGRTIVFASDFAGLEAANADGTGRRTLIPELSYANPDWSPDGSKLIFDSGRRENGQIYVANADGSGMRTLFSPPEGAGYAPAWAPDGTGILLTLQNESFEESIEYLRPDGTTRHVGPTRAIGAMPDWQPCGQGPKCPVAARCVVPRVTGLRLARARTAIRKAGCVVGRISRPRHLALSKLIVSKQSPRAGTRLPYGAKVKLVLRRKR